MRKSTCLSPLAAVGLLAGMVSCGGDKIVLPDEGRPAAIVILQGDGQSGRVGEALPQPLVLQVTDAAGRPVAGATVVIELDGAEPQPATVATEGDGRATVNVLMGPEVGPAPGAARVVMADAGEPVQVDFTLNAVAASADGLSLESGNGQSAPAGQALAAPLVVRVTDAFGNPIPGMQITWAAGGGGSVSEAVTTSDENGRASVIRTLGIASGGQSTEATSGGLAGSPVVFLHTATAGNPAGVSIVSGNEQSGVPGSTLAQPLVVQVADEDGNPVSGAAVTWIVTGGGGSLDPATSTTDQAGRASSSWTLGSLPGSNAAEAVVSGVGQASFRATGLVGGPTQIEIVSGNRQTGQAGQRLSADLVVRVLDAQRNPIPGATVTWQVRSGGGSVDPAIATTDAAGRASARWTLGSAPGANSVEAAVPGMGAVTFEATAAAGAASALAVATQPSENAQAGLPFGRQPVVQLRDAAGNDISQPGVAITAAVATGGGTLGGTMTRATDGNGRVAFTDLRINGAVGTHTLIFASAGFASVNSAGVEVERAVTATTITSDTPEPSEPGASVTVSFTVTSGAGTPTGTVTVSAASGETCPQPVELSAGGGSCTIVLNGEGNRELTASYAGAPLFASSGDTESHNVAAPPNVPPSFTRGPDQSTSVAAGAQTVAGWATAISPGPASEAGQTVEFEVQVVSGGEFFATGTEVAISPDGTLTYTPGSPGTARVEVQLQDNGGTANGGDDTSDPVTVNFFFTP
ncbi:MAG: Ig-like domain-containing protein [Gemmatimonadales bacterium]|nr:Ig-like domain-containing protein [Gemmatimonadales bacterium]